MVVAELNKNINGNVSIQEVNVNLFTHFPSVGVSLKNILITDSQYNKHHKALLKAEKLNVRVSAFRLFKKENPVTSLLLSNAVVYAFTDSTGYSNTSIIKKAENQNKAEHDKDNDFFKTLSFQMVQLIIDNKKIRKLHEFYIDKLNLTSDAIEGGTQFTSTASIQAKQLDFDFAKGIDFKKTGIKGKFTLLWKNKHLLFTNIPLNISDQLFTCSGNFGLGTHDAAFRLHIVTKALACEKIYSILKHQPRQNLPNAKVTGSLDAEAFISGTLQSGKPAINISWSGKKIGINSPQLQLSDAKFIGIYNNENRQKQGFGNLQFGIEAGNINAKWNGAVLKAKKLKAGNLQTAFALKYSSNVVVAVENLIITDSLYQQHGKPLIKANELAANLIEDKLIGGGNPLSSLTIKNAEVYIYTNKEGYSNVSMLRRKSPVGNSATNNNAPFFEKLVVHNTKLTIDNKKKRKLHEFTVSELETKTEILNAALLYKTNASIKVGQMVFNMKKGGYLHNTNFVGNFDLQFKNNHLLFDSIKVKIGEHPFSLSGNFDLGNKAPQYSLHILTQSIPYNKALSFLTAKLAKSIRKVEVKGNLDAEAFITGPLKGGEPLLNIHWFAKEVEVINSLVTLSEATFKGTYNNEINKHLERGDPNSSIIASNMTAKWREIPVTIHKLKVSNLKNPILTTDLSSTVPLIRLNELIKSNTLELESGSADIFLNYNGPLEGAIELNPLINGHVNFTKGKILYKPTNVQLTNLSGKLRFYKSDLFVENIHCNVFNTSVDMNGTGKQLLSLINTNPNQAVIDWNISTHSLDLNYLLFLFQQNKNKQTNQPRQGVAGLAKTIDQMLEESILNVSFRCNNVTYKKFHATNLQTNISLLQDRYQIQNASMNHAGGSMYLRGALLQQNNGNHLNFNSEFKNVDVSSVFDAFENFGQNGITGSQIDGKLTATINGTMDISPAGKVLPHTIKSEVDFSLVEGSLKNFEPIKKIQRHIFKKRNFDNISFAELKNKLYISNTEITINRMEIQSSVLSFFVEGLYSMKGNTDISIQVPLSNLKKRNADYTPTNIGIHEKTGSSIYLRGKPGKDGNIEFSPDIFKKFYKNKKANKK